MILRLYWPPLSSEQQTAHTDHMNHKDCGHALSHLHTPGQSIDTELGVNHITSSRFSQCARFTLVELLVVIAIISVLAGFLLPALNRARESARKTFCANTEKQVALGIFNFANDYHGYLPCAMFAHKEPGYTDQLFPPVSGITIPWNNQTWCERDLPSNLIWPYWEPIQKAICPSHPNYSAFKNLIDTGQDSWQQSTSYLLADSHFSHWFEWSRTKKRISTTPHPARLFMLLEREDYPNQNTNNFQDSVFKSSSSTYGIQALGYHHMNYGGFNACFFDGHVRFYHFNHQPVSKNDGALETVNW